MSDANKVRKRQAQVELCRDLLLSTVHNSLTSFRQAILAAIDEHNKDLPLTTRVSVIRNDQDLRDLFRSITGEVNDVTSDVIYEMSHAIEDEDAETP